MKKKVAGCSLQREKVPEGLESPGAPPQPALNLYLHLLVLPEVKWLLRVTLGGARRSSCQFLSVPWGYGCETGQICFLKSRDVDATF